MKKSVLYIVLVLIGVLVGVGIAKFYQNSSPQASSQNLGQEEEEIIWTCSMHPEIRQNEPGLCPICGMDLTPMDNDNESLDPNLFTLSERALALADVQTEIVNQQNSESGERNYTGRIEATDASGQVQSAYVSGRIEKLHVNTTGKMVRKGQVLGTIYSPELLSAQQELLSAYKRKDQNPSLYKAISNKLLQWKWTQKQIDELIEKGEPQAYFPIQAMVQGEVIEKYVSEGSYVEAGQELFRINNLSNLWGIIDIPESEASQFKEGDQVNLSTSSQKDIQAKIDLVHPLVDPLTRTVQLRVELPNTDKKLKPGMLVRAKIQGKGNLETKGIYISKSAVLWTGKRSLVYVVHRDQGQLHFEMREVELGARLGDQYEILNGLENGEEVVSHGTFTVDAAAQLQGKSSMMNHQKEEQIELTEEDQENLLEVMHFYFELKDVFVSSEADDVADQAEKSITEIEKLHFHLSGKAEKLWNDVLQNWHQIAHSENIDEQRLYFKNLNISLIPLAKPLKHQDETWYLQECPMADDDQGGFWISLDKEIINPYFGDRMLKCGGIEEEWEN